MVSLISMNFFKMFDFSLLTNIPYFARDYNGTLILAEWKNNHQFSSKKLKLKQTNVTVDSKEIKHFKLFCLDYCVKKAVVRCLLFNVYLHQT